jgi:hypothetical protein
VAGTGGGEDREAERTAPRSLFAGLGRWWSPVGGTEV